MDVQQHTPGPWAIADGDQDRSPGDEGPRWDIHVPHKQSIGYVHKEPDARLIAAAPELLALCEEMVDCLDSKMVEAHDSGGLAALGITHSDEGCSLCKARRIIAKARLSQPPEHG